MELYEHQARAIDNLRQSLRSGHKRPVIQMPTGAGKTVIAGHIAEGALGKGNRLIFAVPRISLINQTVESFKRHGIDCIGVLQAEHELTDPAQPIQICSIQTLQRRRWLPHGDIVVIDEAHERHEFVFRWMEHWNATPFIGLSATPWAKGMGRYWDDLIMAATTQELIDKGFLSDFRVYAPHRPNLRGVPTKAGDYVESRLTERMSPLTADIVSTWLDKGESRPTLCFAVDRAHAKELQQEFWQAGVATGYVDHYSTLQQRDEVASAFNQGHIKVVCNVNCLSVGVDWDVRCIILARPTKSPIRHVQTIGRALRPAPGKEALILDHSDSHARLGFVTDIHCDELDKGDQPKHYQNIKTKQPTRCPRCFFMRPAGKATCPECGYKPAKRNKIATNKGELTLIRSQERYKTTEQRSQLYGELRYIQRVKGRAPGWTAHVFKELTGSWPQNGERNRMETPQPETWHIVEKLVERYVERAKRNG